MTTPGLGYNSFIALGEEDTWGDEVARTKFFEINRGSDGLEVKEDKIRSESVYGIEYKDADTIQGPITVDGDVAIDMRFENCGIWLKHALGAEGTSQANGTDATLHRYTMADTLPAGLSCEVKRDVKSFIYLGCKVNTLSFDVASTGILKMTPGLVSKDCDHIGTSTDPTGLFSTSTLINSGLGSVTYAGTEKDIMNCNIALDNALNVSRRFVGTRTIAEPVRGGKLKYGGSFECEFYDDAEYQDFRDATSREFVMTFEGDTIVGTTKEMIEFNFPSIKLLNAPIKINDEGPITMKLNFEGYALGTTGTDRSFYVDIVNTVAALLG